MKSEEALSTTTTTTSSSSSTPQGQPQIDTIDKAGTSSPKSAFERLCRKLSPKRAEKPSLSVDPDVPKLGGELERVFRYFDQNGDGKISPAELQSCVRIVGGELSPEEAEAVVESSDSDGDGLLGLEDFAKLMKTDDGGEKDLREAFGMYEMEGSGNITPKSLKRMLGRLGESKKTEECKAMIRMFDLNGDGVLSFDEFRVMMTQTTQPRSSLSVIPHK